MLNIVWLIKFLFIINKISAVSYNQPKFCPDARWNPNAVTFANQSTVGIYPWHVFVDIKDTVYVIDDFSNVTVFSRGSITHIPFWTSSSNYDSGLFITSNGDIYIVDELSHDIVKWTLDTKQWIRVTQFNDNCEGLFIDINDNIYCSLYSKHQVVKSSLTNKSNAIITVAGNGTRGSLPHMLNSPMGIFVDTNLDLYVADALNNRIQCFVYGQRNGKTIAGNKETIELRSPTGIVLDADKYIFVVERANNRIVRSEPKGFQCLFGCSNLSGSASNQLSNPRSISFDSLGNIFVADVNNHRIQKILLVSNSCSNCSISSITLISKLSNTNVIEYKFNEEIFVSSNIQIQCKKSVSITKQWAIQNCTTTCSNIIQLNKTIQTTSNDLYLPRKTLTYGKYNIKLTVNLIDSPTVSSEASIKIEIIRSDKIILNLIDCGTSAISLGQSEKLILEPGIYSVDGDGNQLIDNEWNFKYFCRIYAVNETTIISSEFSDMKNSSCFNNQFFDNNQSYSTLTIPSNSFQSKRSYLLKVEMQKRINPTRKFTDELLVHVQDNNAHRIAIKCVISTMCASDDDYQLINPTTQVALTSHCLDDCLSSIKNIHWHIYSGFFNRSINSTQWSLFNEDIQTFGNSTDNLTVTDDLFIQNSDIEYWQFEVVYQFQQGKSFSSKNFQINQRPAANGSCSIDPLNGTITTLFTISCSNWFDANEIKDYSFYRNGYSKRFIIGFSISPRITVRLPIVDTEKSFLNLSVDIRDRFDCIKEYQIPTPVYLSKEVKTLDDLIGNLSSGNQNDVGQIVAIVSQQFKQATSDSLEKIASGKNGIPLASISVSSLTSQRSSSSTTKNSHSTNHVLLNEYQKYVNNHSVTRELMTNSTLNQTIAGIKSLILQASTLAQTTESINELTRMASMTAAIKCHELAFVLNDLSKETSYDDTKTAVTLLSQCTSNILNAINSPLQGRTTALDLDLKRSVDIEQNHFDQNRQANEIVRYVNQTIELITMALKRHLNIGQQFSINQSEVITSFERILINQFSHSQIKFSSKSNETLLFRTKLDVLAPYGNSQANTNLSRAVSLTMIDPNGREIPLNSTNESIEIIIPRDPNLIIPEMILQNVKDTNHSISYKTINLTQWKPNKNLTISIHFEILPINFNLSYLFTLLASTDDTMLTPTIFPFSFSIVFIYSFVRDISPFSLFRSLVYLWFYISIFL